ncbi:MAG: hypothetical protein IPM34_13205 [Saprospiraceae bacterium]|nr:hypothetical protein [Saprospiraceae bacterium]
MNTKLGTLTISDKNVVSIMINYYWEALNWQTDLSFVYLNLGALYGMSLKQLDSAEHYLNLAINTTPSWVLAYTALNDVYMKNESEKIKFHGTSEQN